MPIDLNLASFFTVTLTNETFEIPDGALEIFIENIGAADCSWQGNIATLNGKASSLVTLPKGQAFAYGYVGKGRRGFLLDATNTTVNLSITGING